jgi:hypothetical protein
MVLLVYKKEFLEILSKKGYGLPENLLCEVGYSFKAVELVV